jgi:serine protease inhibitor
LSEWTGRLEPRAVRVKLPRYRMEQACELGGALRAMGMMRAFTPDAEFGGMLAAGARTTGPFFVSAVYHKAFVDVSELGTEAAAATAINIKATATMLPQKTRPFIPVFVADHPFLFLIRDVGSGNILFMGRFARP